MDRRAIILTLAGSVLLGPLVAGAQEPGKMYRIAVVHVASPVESLTKARNPRFGAFFTELRDQGFVEGQNLLVERRSAQGLDEARFPEVAAEVVRLKPDVIVVYSTRLALAFKNATTTIPIVAYMADPIGLGVVTNLARPGGNLTGITSDTGAEMTQKRIDLLMGAVPNLSRLGVLGGSPIFDRQQRDVYQRPGLTVRQISMEGFTKAQYQAAFSTMSQARSQAILVEEFPEHEVNVLLIGGLAIQGRLPTMCARGHMVTAENGCLMSQGVDNIVMFRRHAADVARVLKGAKPGDLPVEQPTRFELVINLKTAKALGLTIQPSLLLQADQVVDQ